MTSALFHSALGVSADAKDGARGREGRGRDERVRALFDAHYDFVWRTIRRLGLTDSESDDAAQNVFIVATRRLEDIEPSRERAFLFGAALRVVADVRKSAAKRYEVPSDETDNSPSWLPPADEALSRERARATLDALIIGLPLELRAVFVLHELEGLTMAEMAEILEIAPGTVASRLRRARELFQTKLQRIQRGEVP
jgi:RNA polymerase sigma-70 factor (ECF subfamily)